MTDTVKKGGTKALLESITSKSGQTRPPAEPAQSEIAVEKAPASRKVKKTISISVDTLKAIQLIQTQAIENGNKKPSDSAVIDEAVSEFLSSKGLSV